MKRSASVSEKKYYIGGVRIDGKLNVATLPKSPLKPIIMSYIEIGHNSIAIIAKLFCFKIVIRLCRKRIVLVERTFGSVWHSPSIKISTGDHYYTLFCNSLKQVDDILLDLNG